MDAGIERMNTEGVLTPVLSETRETRNTMSGRQGGTDRLTDVKVRAFLRRAKPGQKLSDGGRLYLMVTPSGTPVFRIDDRIPITAKGRAVRKTYSVGVYDEITLVMAREARAAVRAHLRACRKKSLVK